MEIYIAILAYVFIGIILNFYGPLARKIWAEKVSVLAVNNIGKIRLFLFVSALRIGVALLYPLFLFELAGRVSKHLKNSENP
jgi:hypothetical protein